MSFSSLHVGALLLVVSVVWFVVGNCFGAKGKANAVLTATEKVTKERDALRARFLDRPRQTRLERARS